MADQEPESVRVRSSGDPERPIELAVNDTRDPESGWTRVRLTRSQGRHLVLAVQATLIRTLPVPIIHAERSIGGPPPSRRLVAPVASSAHTPSPGDTT